MAEEQGDDYQPPTGTGPTEPASAGPGWDPEPEESVFDRLEVPAVALMLLGGMAVLSNLSGAGTNIVGIGSQFTEQFPVSEAGKFVGNLVQIAVGGLMVYGGYYMKQGEKYEFAVAAAVAASVPCVGDPCCAVGVPFGIWALVLLLRDEVEASFRGTDGSAPGTDGSTPGTDGTAEEPEPAEEPSPGDVPGADQHW